MRSSCEKEIELNLKQQWLCTCAQYSHFMSMIIRWCLKFVYFRNGAPNWLAMPGLMQRHVYLATIIPTSPNFSWVGQTIAYHSSNVSVFEFLFIFTFFILYNEEKVPVWGGNSWNWHPGRKILSTDSKWRLTMVFERCWFQLFPSQTGTNYFITLNVLVF